MSALLLALALSASDPKVERAMLKGEFEKALRLLDAALQKTDAAPARAQLHLQRAVCFQALRQHGRAQGALEAALQHDAEVELDPEETDPALLEALARAREKLVPSIEPKASAPAPVFEVASPLRPLPVELDAPPPMPLPSVEGVAEPARHGGAALPISLFLASAAMGAAGVWGLQWSQGVLHRYDQGQLDGMPGVTRDEMRRAAWVSPVSIAALAIATGLVCWGVAALLRD